MRKFSNITSELNFLTASILDAKGNQELLNSSCEWQLKTQLLRDQSFNQKSKFLTIVITIFFFFKSFVVFPIPFNRKIFFCCRSPNKFRVSKFYSLTSWPAIFPLRKFNVGFVSLGSVGPFLWFKCSSKHFRCYVRVLNVA